MFAVLALDTKMYYHYSKAIAVIALSAPPQKIFFRS